MPKEYSRSLRVAELLQRELAILVQRYTRDSDMGLITLSAIDVSPDLKNAKIFITCMDNTVDVEEIVFKLNEQAGQFRHELGKLITLRVIPKLNFQFDYSLERANRLSTLIDSLHIDNTGKNNA